MCESSDWQQACKEVDIGGIYDEFRSADDAIRQMGYYIKEAEEALREALPNHDMIEGTSLAGLIYELDSSKPGNDTVWLCVYNDGSHPNRTLVVTDKQLALQWLEGRRTELREDGIEFTEPYENELRVGYGGYWIEEHAVHTWRK